MFILSLWLKCYENYFTSKCMYFSKHMSLYSLLSELKNATEWFNQREVRCTCADDFGYRWDLARRQDWRVDRRSLRECRRVQLIKKGTARWPSFVFCRFASISCDMSTMFLKFFWIWLSECHSHRNRWNSTRGSGMERARVWKYVYNLKIFAISILSLEIWRNRAEFWKNMMQTFWKNLELCRSTIFRMPKMH